MYDDPYLNIPSISLLLVTFVIAAFLFLTKLVSALLPANSYLSVHSSLVFAVFAPLFLRFPLPVILSKACCICSRAA